MDRAVVPELSGMIEDDAEFTAPARSGVNRAVVGRDRVGHAVIVERPDGRRPDRNADRRWREGVAADDDDIGRRRSVAAAGSGISVRIRPVVVPVAIAVIVVVVTVAGPIAAPVPPLVALVIAVSI